MYEVVFHLPDRFFTAHAGEALQRAIFSAINGRAATIFHKGEPVWEIEVDTKKDPSDDHHPAIVHFRLETITHDADYAYSE